MIHHPVLLLLTLPVVLLGLWVALTFRLFTTEFGITLENRAGTVAGRLTAATVTAAIVMLAAWGEGWVVL